MKRRIMWIIYILTAIIIIGLAFFVFITNQTNKLPELTFEDMLSYTTKNNENAIITVGIIKDGVSNYSLYGKNGVLLPVEKHIYEISSITKTITASLLFKAIEEGRINMEDCIDKYLDLPKKDHYPTIKQILTHTSGYKGFYFETQMVTNFFNRRNDFYGISKEQLINRIGKIKIKNRIYSFNYSNFGISIIGAILSKIYQEDYTKIIEKYLKEELGLNNTIISNSLGDLGNYWKWLENDAYLPAGGLTSNIEDMLKYAQSQLNEMPEYLSIMHNIFIEINATSRRNANMNIRFDSIGATWIIDSNNNIIWHNGGTSNYNSYIGFDKERQIAVVILSNLPPNYRIPATVMGIKLLKELQIEYQ
jgi:CubicO group peptidase (beta-lactamase class C family)